MATQEPDREPSNEKETRDFRVVERKSRFPERPSPSIVKTNRIINYAFVLIEGLIFLRLLLKVLGGNPANAFVNFVYSITAPFVYPFLTAFNWGTAGTGIGVIEFGSILALGFYILLNYAIVKLIGILVSRS